MGLRRVGPRRVGRVGPRRVGCPKGVGPQKWGGQNPEKVPRRVGGPKGESRRLHTTAREPKRVHFRVRRFKNTTKIPRKDPQEREEGMKIVAGEGKKRAKYWAVGRRGGPAEGRSGGGVGVVRGGALKGGAPKPKPGKCGGA